MVVRKNSFRNIGNCLCGDTKIKLKNTITNEEFEVSLNDFYRLKYNDKFLIKTPNRI